MKITISIDGRDAIPVRAIPLITGWHLSPDVIAHTFARCGDGHDWRLRGISAYMQDSTNGKTLRVEPDTWGPYCIALESLDAQLQEGVEGKEDWRQQSVSKLPARAFVWSDEFEIAYRADLDKEARGLGEDWPAQADVFVWPSESYCAMHFSEIEMLTEGFGSSRESSENQFVCHRPKPRQRYQEELILSTLRKLGHDPLELDLHPNGKGNPGPKSEARESIGNEMTPIVFDKAWERLKKSKEIQSID